MSSRVVVVGEALVDRITDATGRVADVLGGGPFNAARTLGKLGVATAFLGGVSTDRLGDSIRASLEECGVRLGLEVRSPQHTGIAHAALGIDGSATYRFELERAACADVTEAQALNWIHRNEPPHWLHLGTLALVLEPLATAVELLVREKVASTLLFVDPNCRPSVIADQQRYLERVEQVLAHADVIKVSAEDLDYLARGVAHIDAARALQHRTGALVLFTDGGDSVCVFGAGFERQFPVPQVNVVDTVGAGDAFGGAFIASWVRAQCGREQLMNPDAVAAACAFAIDVAAWTCQRAGAQVPNLADLGMHSG